MRNNFPFYNHLYAVFESIDMGVIELNADLRSCSDPFGQIELQGHSTPFTSKFLLFRRINVIPLDNKYFEVNGGGMTVLYKFVRKGLGQGQHFVHLPYENLEKNKKFQTEYI